MEGEDGGAVCRAWKGRPATVRWGRDVSAGENGRSGLG
jgi:hypothetical protein